MKEILDACCGGRMWWWDKNHPLAVYMDKHVAPKGSALKFDVEGGKRHSSPGWSCEPDVVGDFRAMPFEDESFQMVVFDPPHNIRDEPRGVNGLMYGALPRETEQDDLAEGFAECWRVLSPGGTLVFKWAGKIERVKPHFPTTPTVGTRSPRGLNTWWLIFYKPLEKERATVSDGLFGKEEGASRPPSPPLADHSSRKECTCAKPTIYYSPEGAKGHCTCGALT